MIVTTSGKACRCRRYFSDPADVRAVAQLAEAERAEARRSPSPNQAKGLASAHEMRRAEDRVAQWRRGNGELRVEPHRPRRSAGSEDAWARADGEEDQYRRIGRDCSRSVGRAAMGLSSSWPARRVRRFLDRPA